MKKIWTIDTLNGLINNQVEESLNLDYKGAEAIGNNDKKKTEISKDISAMANADGGTIIYGIREYNEKDKKHLPEKIDPIKRIEFTKEWLEQIINSNIRPKIEGLIIHPVEVSFEKNEAVYVVEIPKSNTAHQAADKRYYKRYNFESVPMDDYEIRDIMNRSRNPKIELAFEIEIHTHKKDTFTRHLPPYFSTEIEYKTDYSLKIYATNKGSVYANYVNYYVHIPIELFDVKTLPDWPIKEDEEKNKYVEFYGENTVRDVVDVVNFSYIPKYGPSRFDPILPGMRSRSEKILIAEKPILSDKEIKWDVYADNANVQKGAIKVSDIQIIEINEKKSCPD